VALIETAVVVCPEGEPEAGLLGLRVAGLPLLARALLTAQRAGIARLVVVASAPQQAALNTHLEGDARLAGRVRWLEPADDLASLPGQSLVLLVPVILDAAALRQWLARVAVGGVVTASDDGGIGPLVVPAALLSPCITAARGGETALAGFLEGLQAGGVLVRVLWEGMRPRPVQSSSEVPAIERAMLGALRSPEDGPIVDRFVNRAFSGLITRGLVAWRVTPNQITVASLLAGLLGAWLLLAEGMLTSLGGLVLFQVSVILDHVDGEVARLKFLYSRLGKWLDNVSDHVVDLAVIGSVTWRAMGNGRAGHLAVLGMAAAFGVTGAFLVVFWWSVSGRRPEARTTPLARILAGALTTLANRDGFCLVVWPTLLLDRPGWFLWVLALGANAYWVAWLVIYGLPRRAPAVAAGSAG
jgi:phosphatidylglycerophosphate synthase